MNIVDSRPLMVTIRCLAYNHEPYIRQCLDGFVMQKTNFRFEAIVHDDASTDCTAAIIREYAEKYPDIIKPIFETENQYSKHDGSLRKIMDKACKGKYIAICEGDDYWTDPFKLQKQVDILEQNSHITLVYTAFENVDSKSHRIVRENYENLMKRSFTGNNLPELLNMNYILTCTTMIRRDIYNSDIYKKISFIDFGLFLSAASYGDFYYINEKTASYRLNPFSLTSTQKSFVGKTIFTSYLRFVKFYLGGIPKEQSKEDDLLCAKNILAQATKHGLIFLERDLLRKYKTLRCNTRHYYYLELKCFITDFLGSKKKYNFGIS